MEVKKGKFKINNKIVNPQYTISTEIVVSFYLKTINTYNEAFCRRVYRAQIVTTTEGGNEVNRDVVQETDYKFIPEKTLDELLSYYEYDENSTLTWLEPLTTILQN